MEPVDPTTYVISTRSYIRTVGELRTRCKVLVIVGSPVDAFFWNRPLRLYKPIYIAIFEFPRSFYVTSFLDISPYIVILPNALSITLFVVHTTPPLSILSKSRPHRRAARRRRNAKKRAKLQLHSHNRIEGTASMVLPLLQDSNLGQSANMEVITNETKEALPCTNTPSDATKAADLLLSNRAPINIIIAPSQKDLANDTPALDSVPTYASVTEHKKAPINNAYARNPSDAARYKARTSKRVVKGVKDAVPESNPVIVKKSKKAKNVARDIKKAKTYVSFPRDVEDSLVPKIPLDWKDGRVAITGFTNPANYCYANAVIQCLSSAVPFTKFILDNHQESDGVVGNFARLLKQCRDMKSFGSISLDNFRNSWIPERAPFFDNTLQQDASEFLLAMLSALHEDLAIRKFPNPSKSICQVDYQTAPYHIAGAEAWRLAHLKEDSVVNALFEGQFQERRICNVCKEVYTDYAVTGRHLNLPIPANIAEPSLQQCFDHLIMDEPMCDWRCESEKCKGATKNAKKKTMLERLPPVLVLVLRRYAHNPKQGQWTKKLQKKVVYPTKGLDLSKYTLDGGKKGNQKYDLFGVVCHQGGSFFRGHYTSYVLSDGQWFHADDDKVRRVREQDVVVSEIQSIFVLATC
ncbi:ubiquitin-specific protease doa4 [Tulasnella sp. 419]|nr:ubiquitin-specific protease doa4 [Tulasnella sp. 419]